MGCGLSREFVSFTNVRLNHCKNYEGRYYLSELMCEFVWGIDGHDIYKWAKDKELLETKEDYRSVVDMIRLCKKIKKHRGDHPFTKDERERYLLFVKARNLKKIGTHIVHTTNNMITGSVYEYLITPGT
jgi:hypothetical protein